MGIRTSVLMLLTAVVFALGGWVAGRWTPEEPGPWVATWKGGGLSAEALREEVFRKAKQARLDALDAAGAQRLASEALVSAVLAAEAKRRGLERAAKARGALDEVLAGQLVEADVAPQALKAAAKAEIETYYREHFADAGVTLEEVRPQIESRLWYARRDAELSKLYQRLKSELGVKIDETALQNVVQSAAQVP